MTSWIMLSFLFVIVMVLGVLGERMMKIEYALGADSRSTIFCSVVKLLKKRGNFYTVRGKGCSYNITVHKSELVFLPFFEGYYKNQLVRILADSNTSRKNIMRLTKGIYTSCFYEYFIVVTKDVCFLPVKKSEIIPVDVRISYGI